MKNIKNIFTNKITMVVLACLLLVGVFAGITALATESTPSLELVSINLNHEATPTLKYTVAIKGLGSEDDIPDVANLSMKFWTDAPADITGKAGDVANAANSRMSAPIWDEEKNVAYVDFYSIGFSPKRMTDTIFASAVLVDAEGNVISQTAAKSYSVYEYLCELSVSGASADQQALIAAMKDYIVYAQDYLGWNEDLSPADLNYVKVENATFKVSADEGKTWSEVDYTSGTFSKDMFYQITALDKYVRFVNKGGYICDQHGDNIYSSGTFDEDRMYTALAGTKVNIKTSDDAKVYVQELQVEKADGSNSYAVAAKDINRFVNGESVIIVKDSASYHKSYAFVAPLANAEGKALIGWKNAEGTPVSNKPVLFIDELVDYTAEEVTAEYYPIYDDETADLDHDLLSGNMTLNGNDVDSVEVTDENGVKFNVYRKPVYAENGETVIGWTFDAAERTAYLGNPTATLSHSADTTSGLSMAHLSFKVNVAGKAATGTYADYFVESSNSNLYQMHLRLGDKTPIMFQLTANTSNLTADADYYYLNIVSNSNNGNRVSFERSDVVMEYGVDNKIDMFVEIAHEDTVYETTMVHYYVNDVYAGSCNVKCDGSETFSNTGFAALSATLQGRVCANITITEATVKEWN